MTGWTVSVSSGTATGRDKKGSVYDHLSKGKTVGRASSNCSALPSG